MVESLCFRNRKAYQSPLCRLFEIRTADDNYVHGLKDKLVVLVMQGFPKTINYVTVHVLVVMMIVMMRLKMMMHNNSLAEMTGLLWMPLNHLQMIKT